jgi:plastocyanin
MYMRSPHITNLLGARRAAGLLLVGALGLGLAACGSDDDDSAGATTTEAPSEDANTAPADSAGGATVTAKDFAFDSVTVAAGSEITFENADSASHTLTADDGSFDTESVSAGESASLTAPAEPGTYAFHCSIHPSMKGTLTVD